MFGRQLETTIEIAAPPAKVWEVLTAQADLLGAKSWNPFIVGFEGQLQPGARVEAKFKLPGRSPSTFKPKLLIGEATSLSYAVHTSSQQQLLPASAAVLPGCVVTRQLPDCDASLPMKYKYAASLALEIATAHAADNFTASLPVMPCSESGQGAELEGLAAHPRAVCGRALLSGGGSTQQRRHTLCARRAFQRPAGAPAGRDAGRHGEGLCGNERGAEEGR